jgi:hypothetical protein
MNPTLMNIINRIITEELTMRRCHVPDDPADWEKGDNERFATFNKAFYARQKAIDALVEHMEPDAANVRRGREV